MRLQTRTRLFAAFGIALSALVLLFLLYAQQLTTSAVGDLERISAFKSAFAEFRTVAMDYFVNGGQRPLTQLTAKLRQLDELLQDLGRGEEPGADGRPAWEEARAELSACAALVDQLPVSLDSAQTERDRRTVRLFLLRSQGVRSAVDRLEDPITSRLERGKAFTEATVGVLIAALVVLLALAVMMLERGVLRPLARLGTGLSEVGRGNFGIRLRSDRLDEIGQLAHAFDETLDRLQSITVSRDRLEVEVRVREEAEQAARESATLYRSLFDNMLNGFAYCRMLFDEQRRPHDFIYLEVNQAFEALTGLRNVPGRRVTEVIPGIRESNQALLEAYGRVASTGKAEQFESFVAPLDMWFSIAVYSPKPEHFVAVFDVITERKRAEAALGKSQELLNETQRLAKMGGWEYDVATRRVHWTDEVYRLHGVTKETFDPSDPAQDIEFYAPEDRRRIREAFERAVVSAEPYDLELQLISARGDRLWVRTSGRAERSGSEVVRVFGNITDTTERRASEEALRWVNARFQRLVDANMIGIVIASYQGDVIEANDYYLDILGVARGELSGGDVRWSDMTPPEWRAADEKALDELRVSGTCTPYEKEYLRRDGSRRAVFITDATLPGPDEHILALVLDITERKRAEAAIGQLNAELEERVRHRTSELESANKELESFSYSVSHDLRAPLRAVDGFARKLEASYASVLGDEGRRQLGVIRTSAQRMGQLIDDLLAFSRMGRREMSRASVDMKGLARGVVDELRAAEPARVIDVTIEALPAATGDFAMLRQVWFNLLANAVKFTRPRERAKIEIGWRREGSAGVYWVKDNGVGFDMQYADKLFGVFQRLHAMDEFEGTGVGLALSQRVVHRHGGRIWADARVGQGATFYFALPQEHAMEAEWIAA